MSTPMSPGCPIAVTTAYVAGLVERLNGTVWWMGVDSLAVLVLYVGGMVVSIPPMLVVERLLEVSVLGQPPG